MENYFDHLSANVYLLFMRKNLSFCNYTC